MSELAFFVPSNRRDSRGRPTHVDGWNEYIHAVNKNRYAGAALERENVANVAQFARAAMRSSRYGGLEVPALVAVTFVEVDRRRDVSNVYGGLKWVLDGLTRPRGSKRLGAGLIVDDSPRWCEVTTALEVDRGRPGVRVRVMPLAEADGASEDNDGKEARDGRER